jgi:hypothetical protein
MDTEPKGKHRAALRNGITHATISDGYHAPSGRSVTDRPLSRSLSVQSGTSRPQVAPPPEVVSVLDAAYTELDKNSHIISVHDGMQIVSKLQAVYKNIEPS